MTSGKELSMKISTQTSCTCKKFGLEDGIRRLCEAGFDALDLSLFTMTKDDCVFNSENYQSQAEKIKNIAAEYGVSFNQAHAPFSFKFGDPELFENIIKPRVLRSVEIAGIVGAKSIIVHPLHHMQYKGNEELLFEMNLNYYRMFIPLCEEYGIKIATENMWQRDPIRGYIIEDVCSRGETLAAMVDALNSIAPVFTACLDLGHCGLTGEEAEDAIRILGRDRLGALHIHDNNYISDTHTLPGLGIMHWPEITDALREIGYRGDFTYEADAFLKGFTNDVIPIALKFMVDIARHWAAKCE